MSSLIDNLAWLITNVALGLVLVLAALTAEYGRYVWHRSRWLKTHDTLIGTTGEIIANEDGVSLRNDGTRIPAYWTGTAWRYRHEVGRRVKVLGYPRFGAYTVDPPVTLDVET
jgi:hypothetical protein